VTSTWTIALRNLSRNRRRTLTSGLALAVGVAGISLLGGYVARVELFLRTSAIYLQNTGHVVIYKAGGLEHAAARPRKFNLSASELRTAHAVLSADREVELAVEYLTGVGLLGNGCKSVPFVGLGWDPKLQERVLNHPQVLRVTPDLARPVQGKLLAQYAAVQGAVALSTGLARRVGKTRVHDQLPLGTALTLPSKLPDCSSARPEQLAADANVQLLALAYDGSLAAQDGEIVSTFRTPLEATNESTLMTSLQGLRRLFDTDSATYIAVFLQPDASIEAARARIETRLRGSGLQATVFAFDDERINPYYAGNIAMLRSIFSFFSVLVACVVGLSVVNAMTLTVIERTRELGTLRALGFTRRSLLRLFIRESVLLASAAAGCGIVIAQLCAWLINRAQLSFQPPGVTDRYQVVIATPPALSALICAGLLGLCTLATWSAVRRRVKTGIQQLLSHAAA
jgi:putative ABC transport system permease protein